MSNLNLLAGVQNPFLWESDEMESVESWLGVLICRAGGAAAADSETPGKSLSDPGTGRARKHTSPDRSAAAGRGAYRSPTRSARAAR